MRAHNEILDWLARVNVHRSRSDSDDNNDEKLINPNDNQAKSKHLAATKPVSHPLSPAETTSSDTGAAVPPRPKRSVMSDRGAPTPKRPRYGIAPARAHSHARDARDGGGEDEEAEDGQGGQGGDGREDENETPRASERFRRKSLTKPSATASGSVISSLLSSRSSRSQMSDQSGSGSRSPTKRIAALELQPDGVETRSFCLTDSRLPESLGDLLVEMEACGRGAGVVSRALEVHPPSSSTPNLRGFYVRGSC